LAQSLKRRKFEIHPVVFPGAAALILIFVGLAASDPEWMGHTFNSLQAWIVHNFSWLYVLAMSGFLVLAVRLGMGRYAHIRLGPDDEEPEFSTPTWFAMLFSAGMGIGLLFYSVAEPLYHFNEPPIGEGGTLSAARNAMGLTPFHWGLHPWALYALVALALAYFGFRRGLPLSFRSVFYPLIGERIYGWPGHIIDILACVATLFGVATSLGLGSMQVNAGLNYLFGLTLDTKVQVALIAAITAMATISVVTGLHRGIRRLSEVNMSLMALLLVFVLLVGPSVFLLHAFVENIGAYLQHLPHNSFWTATFTEEAGDAWLGNWTVFYWGWWIAWSPFVGMFIARVSKGRTIQEFIVGVLLVPTLMGVLWLTVFGDSALHQSLFPDKYQPSHYDVQVVSAEHGLPVAESGALITREGVPLEERGGALVDPAGNRLRVVDGRLVTEAGEPYEAPLALAGSFDGRFRSESMALTPAQWLQHPVLNRGHDATLAPDSTVMFMMLNELPLAELTALIATIGVILFFVTSSDSASMVIDIISSGGNQDPPVGTRLFWAITEGVVGALLLLAGAATGEPQGALRALQTASITAALPFSVVIIAMCLSLVYGLRREVQGQLPAEQQRHIAGVD
jgi:choline/carnitine/betaine transport